MTNTHRILSYFQTPVRYVGGGRGFLYLLVFMCICQFICARPPHQLKNYRDLKISALTPREHI